MSASPQDMKNKHDHVTKEGEIMIDRIRWNKAKRYQETHTTAEYVAMLNDWRNNLISTAAALDDDATYYAAQGNDSMADGCRQLAKENMNDAQEVAQEIERAGGSVQTATTQRAKAKAHAERIGAAFGKIAQDIHM